MALDPDTARTSLERFVSDALGRPCHIMALERLTGGTVQENWRVDCVVGEAGGEALRLVLRTSRTVGVKDSLPAGDEFAVLSAAAAAGVRVPRPVAFCEDAGVVGATFFLMEFVRGESRPWKLQRAADVMAQGDSLLEAIGAELARLQTITPANTRLPALGEPPRDSARQLIAKMRAYLDGHDHPHVAIEYALRWLERNAPPPRPAVLCHGDFRIGNIMVDGGRVAAIFDWELAYWGDAHEDLAWFCMPFFRFARPELAGGGIGPRAPLLRGWARARGQGTEAETLRYWDVMANTHWAVLSLQQVARHVSGAEDSLELALVGLGTAEMELEALRLIAQPTPGRLTEAAA
jgi:aminoglycoside phosphotransferase (APT) family kinase protein